MENLQNDVVPGIGDPTQSISPEHDETLNGALTFVVSQLVAAVLYADGVMTTEFFETTLPAYTLNLAEGFLLEEPPVGDVELGYFMVTQEYKDAFLRRLKPIIDEIRGWFEEDNQQEWEHPTPNHVIRKFCLLNHMSHSTGFVNLVWEAAHPSEPWVDSVPDKTMQGRILRWMDTPLKRTTNVYRKPIKSQMDFIKLMHGVMVTKDPKRYGNMPIEHLQWRPVEPTQAEIEAGEKV